MLYFTYAKIVIAVRRLTTNIYFDEFWHSSFELKIVFYVRNFSLIHEEPEVCSLTEDRPWKYTTLIILSQFLINRDEHYHNFLPTFKSTA